MPSGRKVAPRSTNSSRPVSLSVSMAFAHHRPRHLNQDAVRSTAWRPALSPSPSTRFSMMRRTAHGVSVYGLALGHIGLHQDLHAPCRSEAAGVSRVMLRSPSDVYPGLPDPGRRAAMMTIRMSRRPSCCLMGTPQSVPALARKTPSGGLRQANSVHHANTMPTPFAARDYRAAGLCQWSGELSAGSFSGGC